jgi:hypothetical protein
MYRGISVLFSLAICMLMSAGCIQKTRPMREPYFGPTEGLATVLQQIHARNASIDSLRCAGTFSAEIIDPQTKDRTTGDGDVTLLYQPRRNVRLVGKVIGTTVFDIASNDERYWLILPEKTDTMWWGYHRLISTRQAAQLPVRPDLIAQVMGVAAPDIDLLNEPTPLLRFNNDQDCYMITWHVTLSDRAAVQKEVWYDRVTLQPRVVVLFDGDGRVTLRAYLSKPAVVSGFDSPVMLASRYDLFFPDSGSRFVIELADLERTRNGAPSVRSFQFPGDDRAGVSKVIQIDE